MTKEEAKKLEFYELAKEFKQFFVDHDIDLGTDTIPGQLAILVQRKLTEAEERGAEKERGKIIEKYQERERDLRDYYYKKHPNKGKLARVIGEYGGANYHLLVKEFVDSPDGIFIEVQLPNLTSTKGEQRTINEKKIEITST